MTACCRNACFGSSLWPRWAAAHVLMLLDDEPAWPTTRQCNQIRADQLLPLALLAVIPALLPLLLAVVLF
jgi:hypothetical protein